MRSLILKLAVVQIACAAPAMAEPSLRRAAQVDGDRIRVADIWEGAGARSEAVVGPSPPPGRQIVVEGTQLAHIARLFDVPWRPASGGDRIVIERPGRPVPRDEVLDAIRRSLAEAGAPADLEIDLPGLETPLVPPSAAVGTSVESLSFDRATGRFSALLAFQVSGMPTQRQRAAGRLVEVREVAVLTRRLPSGAVLEPADVRLARLPQGRVPAGALPDARHAVGQATRRALGAGQPLLPSDLGAPVVVDKGAMVQLLLESGGMFLAAQGQALTPGGIGERIRVANTLSRAVVDAVVTGPGSARVALEAVPASPPVPVIPGRRAR